MEKRDRWMIHVWHAATSQFRMNNAWRKNCFERPLRLGLKARRSYMSCSRIWIAEDLLIRKTGDGVAALLGLWTTYIGSLCKDDRFSVVEQPTGNTSRCLDSKGNASVQNENEPRQESSLWTTSPVARLPGWFQREYHTWTGDHFSNPHRHRDYRSVPCHNLEAW